MIQKMHSLKTNRLKSRLSSRSEGFRGMTMLSSREFMTKIFRRRWMRSLKSVGHCKWWTEIWKNKSTHNWRYWKTMRCLSNVWLKNSANVVRNLGDIWTISKITSRGIALRNVCRVLIKIVWFTSTTSTTTFCWKLTRVSQSLTNCTSWLCVRHGFAFSRNVCA